jgi:hypothetical protein
MPSREDIRRRDRFAALVLVILIAALALAILLRRSVFEDVERSAAVPRVQHEAIEFDRFSARRERSAEGDRLTVTMRLRTTMGVSLPCAVFVLARNDQSSPKLWAIWPPQPPGSAVSAGGHFSGTSPGTGYAVTLTDQWTRITATIPHPSGTVTFDAVEVYVVDPEGRILLARPFRV